jgi:hypothetical protein
MVLFLLYINRMGKVPRDVAIVKVCEHVHDTHTVRFIVTDDAVLKVDTAKLTGFKGVLIGRRFKWVVEKGRRGHSL